MKLTNLQFSQQAANLAKNCAAWAADSLTLLERVDQPMRQEAVERFLTYVRERCDDIERWSKESP